MATTKTLTVADVKAMLRGEPVTPVVATPKPLATDTADEQFTQVYGEPPAAATDSNQFLGTFGPVGEKLLPTDEQVQTTPRPVVAKLKKAT
jgi:hypothetical protein